MTGSKIRHYFEHPKWRLLASQVLAQAILFLSLPLISRIFPALEIGRWSVFQSFALFLWSFSQLKTDISLIQADTEEERRGLVFMGLTLHLLISSVGILVLGMTNYGARLGFTDLWLLLVYLAGFGLNQMAQNYLLSKQLYSELTAIRVLTPLLSFPGSLLLMLLQVPNGLMIGLLAGAWIPAIRPFYQNKIVQCWRQDTIHNIKTYWNKHQKNATLGSINALVGSLSDQLLVLIIANYFKENIVAAYFMASRLCTAPISIVAASIGQYNFRLYQELHRKGQFLPKIPIAYWKKWLPVALVYYGALILFGSEIFVFVLGKDWAYAGYLASLLATPSALIFLTSPTSSAFTVIQKQEYVLALSAGTFIRLFCMMLAIWYEPANGNLCPSLRHNRHFIYYTFQWRYVVCYPGSTPEKVDFY